jgi:phosphoribosylformylglycinamidine synthase
VENTVTIETIKFDLEAENPEVAKQEVQEMCERLLCNPVIHDYQIQINQAEE